MSKKQKTFLGMPMNWDYKNIFGNIWNKNSDVIFPPKTFGIGWNVNFHALLKATGVIKAPIKKASKAKSKAQTGAKGSP